MQTRATRPPERTRLSGGDPANGSRLRELVHEAANGLHAEDRAARETIYDCPACSRALRFTTGSVAPHSCDGGCDVQAIQRAAQRLIDTPAPSLGPTEQPQPRKGILRTPASQVRARPIHFLVPQRVPTGALTLLAGDPGLGKSTWTDMLGAKTSSGQLGKPGRVLIANAEDSPEAVVKPRLAAAGADLEMVEFVTVTDEHGARGLTLPDDLPKLTASIERSAASLLILDPLNAFLSGSVDGHRDQQVRRALAPLARLAEQHHLAVLVVVHLNKAPGTDALYRVGGSIGLVGGARSLLTFTRDPDDPDGENGNRRLLSHTKSNWGKLAKGLLYDITEHELDLDGHRLTTTTLEEAGESDVTGSEALGASDGPSPATRRELAAEILGDLLGDGQQRRRGEIAEQAARRGISDRTLDRAAHEVGVLIDRQGFPSVTYWRLPHSPANPSPATVAGLDVAGLADPHEHWVSDASEPQSRHTPESGGTDTSEPTAQVVSLPAWANAWADQEGVA